MSNTTLSHEDVEAFLQQHEQKQLLRLITCGSVDDGKSTLIGRLMLETGAIFDDQLAALRQETKRHGTLQGSDVDDDVVDAALLLDGLEDERQQGITIDVAYRYFTTTKRKFIIADTPGHEQYTRNMATGASTAHLAIILIDARKGLLAQTRRHAFIVSQLGLPHVVVAVNKMDLVEYSQDVFDSISKAFHELAETLHLESVTIIPVSGLRGDNIRTRSSAMPWYQGPTLLETLESVPTESAPQSYRNLDFRFPVQMVNRPNSEFRGYSGTVAAGSIRVGTPIKILPAGHETKVVGIHTFDGAIDVAIAGDAVTLILADELDVARGDTLVHRDATPEVAQHFEANLVWMSTDALIPGKQYWLKHTSRSTSCEVDTIRFAIDVNTFQHRETSTLKLNEMGRCVLQTHAPLVFDDYQSNRTTGAFILVDRASHETVAAGMIVCRDHRDEGYWDERVPGYRLEFAPSTISAEQRQERLQQAPLTILITGLSGAGKTSTALALEKLLFEQGFTSLLLDGQNLRHGISRDLGFSTADRSENLRRAAEIAKLATDAGLIAIGAFVAPDPEVRAKVRSLLGESRVFHVHLDVPVEVCKKRDASGRYQAAEEGRILSFPGVTADYPVQDDADLILEAQGQSSEQLAQTIVKALGDRLRPSGSSEK